MKEHWSRIALPAMPTFIPKVSSPTPMVRKKSTLGNRPVKTTIGSSTSSSSTSSSSGSSGSGRRSKIKDEKNKRKTTDQNQPRIRDFFSFVYRPEGVAPTTNKRKTIDSSVETATTASGKNNCTDAVSSSTRVVASRKKVRTTDPSSDNNNNTKQPDGTRNEPVVNAPSASRSTLSETQSVATTTKTALTGKNQADSSPNKKDRMGRNRVGKAATKKQKYPIGSKVRKVRRSRHESDGSWVYQSI